MGVNLYTLKCQRPFKTAEKKEPKNHVGESDEAAVCWKWQLH